METLEKARITAEKNSKGRDKKPEYVKLGEQIFEIMPFSTNGDICYRYILKGGGIKLYFHTALNIQGIQPVRVHYEAESLIGRSIFDVNSSVRKLLQELKFHVKEEKISRIDLQVMCEIPVERFMQRIGAGHIVKRASKEAIYCSNGGAQSYRLGVGTIMRIYDKRAEMLEKQEVGKMALMLEECFGQEFPDVCTRIEFQLRRAILKEMGIDSVADLQSMETSLVEWLTNDWFRILDGPKIKGNEKKQKLASEWKTVQNLFKEYFNGEGKSQESLLLGEKRPLKMDAKALIAQAAGCLAAAHAIENGVDRNPNTCQDSIIEMINPYMHKIWIKSGRKASEYEISSGISAVKERCRAAGFPWEEMTVEKQEAAMQLFWEPRIEPKEKREQAKQEVARKREAERQHCERFYS